MFNICELLIYISKHMSYSFVLLPVIIDPKNEMTDRIRNTTKSSFPISAEKPAMPLAPRKNATRARIKKEIAARIIHPPVKVLPIY